MAYTKIEQRLTFIEMAYSHPFNLIYKYSTFISANMHIGLELTQSSIKNIQKRLKS
jgi:hypothetical protein